MLYLRTPSRGLNEPVKNSHDGEMKAVIYHSNLSLQDEEKLSYATYFEALRLGYQRRLFQKHHKCVPAVYAPVLKRMRKIPPWFMRPKSKTSNFKLLVTLPNNTEAGKRVSVTNSSHRIRPEQTK